MGTLPSVSSMPPSSSKCSINIQIVLSCSKYLSLQRYNTFILYTAPFGPTSSCLSPHLVVLYASQVLLFLPLQCPNHLIAPKIWNPLSGIVIFRATDFRRAFADCRGGSSYLFPWCLSRMGPTMGIGDVAVAVNQYQSIFAPPCSPMSPPYPVSCSLGILVQLTVIWTHSCRS